VKAAGTLPLPAENAEVSYLKAKEGGINEEPAGQPTISENHRALGWYGTMAASASI